MFMNTILSMFQSVKQYTVSGNLINWESGGKVWHFVTEQSKWIWMSYQPAWTACVLTVILQSWTLSHVNISRSAGSHSTELRTARIRKLVFHFPAVLRWRKVFSLAVAITEKWPSNAMLWQHPALLAGCSHPLQHGNSTKYYRTTAWLNIFCLSITDWSWH